jgi:type I restriction enzyme, R subunit
MVGVAADLSPGIEGFDGKPFAKAGGIGKVHQVFGDGLNKIIDDLNGTLAA